MKILQINTTVNSGSTGRIAEDIGKVLIAHRHESFIAYGRGNQKSQSQLIKIGNQTDIYLHGLKTAIFDRHGFGSKKATLTLIQEIEKINPDAIGLHNLHGYYLNIEVLFDYLKVKNVPVLWTLFDCWAFTGHCSYFDDIDCKKYQIQCEKCPKSKKYPSSYFLDNSYDNYLDKKRLFTGLKHIEFVVHSQWLKEMVGNSFLKSIASNCLPSGIDLNLFKPVVSDIKKKNNIDDKKVVLGCASQWSERKGLKDFINLWRLLDENTTIVLIGVSDKQIKLLPPGIIGIPRTESIQELVMWYSAADVFVNPTYQDNFPTTNIEALACGTPVITYNTGGSPEAIDSETGVVVNKGDVEGLANAIHQILLSGNSRSLKCRERAEQNFDKNDRYLEYLDLFVKLIERSK
ncbi:MULTISPECIES: glycosyltransferase [unclassified Flavobacterium]|uniref:glycosyltransferase n=1 Tax=unclassified Flavobacterium TaxID=196869 RepID=UPI001291CDD6|nr:MULTISPECIES: glycosyltransferase [unclassified Flavobacterium]MQP52058.1 glycosyltransferase [Flavobacterium sp. LMO9]MQP61927.1 glycosyltransferase [Flavobacterium sp. LMO6]